MPKIEGFTKDFDGLTDAEAEQGLETYSENIYKPEKITRFPLWQSFFNMRTVVLFSASLIFGFVKNDILSCAVCFITALMISIADFMMRSYCNERTAAHRESVIMKYRTLRDGETTLVPENLLVPDDIIMLEAGEKVPADSHILELYDLTVNESAITGNEAPVTKKEGFDSTDSELKASCLYAGTRILTGKAVVRIFATSVDTQYYIHSEKKISDDSAEAESERRYAFFSALSSITGFVVFAAFMVKCLFFSSASVPDSILLSLGAMVFVLPVSVPLFIRFSHIRGAQHILNKGAVFKSYSDIEALSTLDCVVLDKSIVARTDDLEIAGIYTENFDFMHNVTLLAGNKDDPTLAEQAFMKNAVLQGRNINIFSQCEILKSYSYDLVNRMSGNLCLLNNSRLLCVKGDAEKITALCRMPQEAVYRLMKRVEKLEKRGLVIEVSAYAVIPEEAEIPDSLYTVSYTYMGMCAYESATVDTVPYAVQSIRRAGLRAVLVSPDNEDTALAMAAKLGIKSGNIISGDELFGENCDADISGVDIFARVPYERIPEVIEKLRWAGIKTAVYSENPDSFRCIKASDMAFSSFDTATGSMFDACNVILSEDNLADTADIVRLSKGIENNVRKMLTLIFTATSAMTVTALIGLFLPVGIFTPVVCALISCVILPALLFTFANPRAESGIIKKNTEDNTLFRRSLLYGIVTGCAVGISAFLISFSEAAGALSSAVLVMCSLTLVLYALFTQSYDTNILKLIKGRGVSASSVLTFIAIIAVAIMTALVPVVAMILGAGTLSPLSLIITVIVPVILVLAKILFKLF